MPETYTCAVCRGTFEKGWSEEEAQAELKQDFNVPVEQCDIVCDDCYKEMFPQPRTAI